MSFGGQRNTKSTTTWTGITAFHRGLTIFNGLLNSGNTDTELQRDEKGHRSSLIHLNSNVLVQRVEPRPWATHTREKQKHSDHTTVMEEQILVITLDHGIYLERVLVCDTALLRKPQVFPTSTSEDTVNHVNVRERR